MDTHSKPRSGNPILRRPGVCDPHVRIFNDRAWLYATHDKSPDSATFVMEDWWVWSSPDLVNWTRECTLRPEDTCIDSGFTSCWATDAALTYDRHASFFEWRGQWYYICNDMSQTRSEFFRESSIGYVFYRDNGEIEPVRLTTAGVALP